MPPVPFPFRSPPFPHQLEEWEKYRETVGRMILWEQGTGKSKETIDQASWCYLAGLIDAVIVVAPNGVHRNWVEEEIPAHLPDLLVDRTRALFYQSSKADTLKHKRACRQLADFSGFVWFTISYEAFTTNSGKAALIELFHRRRVFYVLDEAHYVNNPEATRTQSILKSSTYATMRRVLTGTPISTGPFNMFTLVNFLDPTYWLNQGLSTFTEYRNHFAIIEKAVDPNGWSFRTNPATGQKQRMPGREFEVVKSFRRLDQLREMLRPWVSRVTKESAGLKLPPKKYTRWVFDMSLQQAELYREMHDEYRVWLAKEGITEEEGRPFQQSAMCFECGGKKEVEVDGYIYPCPGCASASSGLSQLDGEGTLVAAEMIMTRQLRLQQITCGYLPTEEDDEPVHVIPGDNPRLQALRQIVGERVARGVKLIVWARFQLDITLIMDALKRDGIRAVRYDGTVSEADRAEAKALFKGVRPIFAEGTLIGREEVPPSQQAQVFVGNPAAGATGLTLNQAKAAVYYSNSFKLIDRLQSEDRCHRIGQDSEVEYIDLVAAGTIDDHIASNLRTKFGVASEILGDDPRSWI